MSAQKPSPHEGQFTISRNGGWIVHCRCKVGPWTGSEYPPTEDLWREHVWQVTGRAPEAMGDKSGPRWQPPAPALPVERADEEPS